MLTVQQAMHEYFTFVNSLNSQGILWGRKDNPVHFIDGQIGAKRQMKDIVQNHKARREQSQLFSLGSLALEHNFLTIIYIDP